MVLYLKLAPFKSKLLSVIVEKFKTIISLVAEYKIFQVLHKIKSWQFYVCQRQSVYEVSMPIYQFLKILSILKRNRFCSILVEVLLDISLVES